MNVSEEADRNRIDYKEWKKENSPSANYDLDGFQLSPPKYGNKPLSGGRERRVDYPKEIPGISFRNYPIQGKSYQGKKDIYSERENYSIAA